VFSNHFNALISKIIFKKLKKYYFNIFPSEKHFKKQLQSRSETHSLKSLQQYIMIKLIIINNTSNHKHFLYTKASLRVIFRVELCIA